MLKKIEYYAAQECDNFDECGFFVLNNEYHYFTDTGSCEIGSTAQLHVNIMTTFCVIVEPIVIAALLIWAITVTVKYSKFKDIVQYSILKEERMTAKGVSNQRGKEAELPKDLWSVFAPGTYGGGKLFV